MVGMSMARSTRSGTLVGPGICRKCLPVCTVMGVLPDLASALRAARIPLFGGLVPRPAGAANAPQAGLALPSWGPAGKTGPDIKRDRSMAAGNAENSRNSAENRDLAARLAREITGGVLF